MFGGHTQNIFGGELGRFGDMWQLQRGVWTELRPAVMPSARHNAAMTYDVANRQVILFGGMGALGYLGDTWLWDGEAWRQASPVLSPSPREGATMVWDGTVGRVMLFGGMTEAHTASSETWHWQGNSWQLRTLAAPPQAAARVGLAYDSRRNRVVMFGGDLNTATFDTVREWDGQAWQPIIVAYRPLPRSEHAMVFDPVRGRTVIFGGTLRGLGRWLTDTWEWDGVQWESVFADPGAGSIFSYHPGVYDARRREMVVVASDPVDFGGTPHPVRILGYRWDDATAGGTVEACEVGTHDTDGDGLKGCADPDCWGRCTPLCPPYSTCPANASRCGDGACNAALEDAALCPVDCN